jgi:hypothetical protein
METEWRSGGAKFDVPSEGDASMSDEMATASIAVAGLLAGKDALSKLLGPTAEYLGEGMRDLAKRSFANVGRILTIACDKLGDKLEEPGQVNPRVLKHIVDDGRFVEDVFAAEYFGGLLASGRSDKGEGDTVLPHLNLVKSMPSIQLRLHYVIYQAVARLPYGREADARPDLWEDLVLSIDGSQLVSAMNLEGGYEGRQVHEAVLGLIDAKLIEAPHALYLCGYDVRYEDSPAHSEAIVIRPNRRGANLFLKAMGYHRLAPDLITSVTVEERLSEDMKKAMAVPVSADHQYRSARDRVEYIRSELDEKIDDVEASLDDLRELMSKPPDDPEQD